jgi:hypothetical protein
MLINAKRALHLTAKPHSLFKLQNHTFHPPSTMEPLSSNTMNQHPNQQHLAHHHQQPLRMPHTDTSREPGTYKRRAIMMGLDLELVAQ